jgi:predicted ATPase
MKITINSTYKSIPRGTSFDLPDFCILTGKNGSGKSHLLEAIANTNIANTHIDGMLAMKIHHVGFNALNPQVDEQCDSNQVNSQVQNWWNQINGIVNEYRRTISNGEKFNNVITEYLPRHGNNPVLHSTIASITRSAEKDLDQLTESDVFNYLSFADIAQNSLFFSQCALIFKAYHTRQMKNGMNEYRAVQHGIKGLQFVSESEFAKKYGPPPWDLINEILSRAGLSYRVSSPDAGDYDLPYRLRLLDKKNKIEISVNDLSSGEKVLMSLALAIYNTHESGSKPDLLLLDEPDAPLHPQFSKLLMDTLAETIVKKSGVKVIVTTHSPSTVAIAPNNCIFEMDKDSRIPRLVSNAHALNTLTEGIPYLKVSYEKRRQVFVESKYDAEYYQRLYNLLNNKHRYTYQAVFLEPHRGTSNCGDVVDIVQKLVLSGNDLVWGIIDFDNKNTSENTIVVLGDGSRYAIENYILDPIYVCLSLIRSGKKSFSDFGISEITTYPNSSQLSEENCQTITDNFLSQLDIPFDDVIESKLENGFSIRHPKSFLTHQGHEYEIKLLSMFPSLHALKRGRDDAALKMEVLRIIEEFPQFLSEDVSSTLKKICN